MGADTMFPVSIKGAIDVPSDEIDAALGRLRAVVAKARPRLLERRGQVLTFWGGMFRWVPGWNILSPVDECTVTVGSGKLRYDCSTRETLIATIVMAVGVWAVIFLMESKSMPPGAQIAVLLGTWLWLFGMNYLTTYVRLRRFFARAVMPPASGNGND